MTETFEVGQKARHQSRGDVEVTYGPFENVIGGRRYVVRVADGREVMVTPDVLTSIPETPKFTVGDVVSLATRAGAKATVEYGPFDNRDVYVVKLVDEPADADDIRTFTAMAHVMTKASAPIKVGDRVRVVKGDDSPRFVGEVGVLKQNDERDHLPYLVEFGDGRGYHGDPNGQWWCREVERVEDENTVTYSGVTYELGVRYRDRDGDYWSLRRNPELRDEIQAQMAPVDDDEWDHYTLSTLVALYSPLTLT